MRGSIKFRMIALAVGIGLTALAIVVLIVASQRQASGLRAQLTRVDSETFRIADQFRDSLRSLNESMYHYGRSHVDPDTNAFARASEDLHRWIAVQTHRLGTPEEEQLMEQLEGVYTNYLKVATALLARLEAIGEESATIDEYTELRTKSQELFDLGQRLSRAHFASRNQILSQANQGVTQLRWLMLVALGALLALVLMLGALVFRDMIVPLQTRLVESQMLLERQEKLASLGMLAAGIAHEIRNPLTAIKAALFIQQKKCPPGTPDHADAQLVEREILRLERIVSDFLLFARPMDPERATVATEDLLHDVGALMERTLAEDGIRLVIEESPALSLEADAGQIKQVLLNLVRNAAEAIGQNGVIRLRTRADRKRLGDREQDVVVLEVADNGKGIPPEVEKRLFDPFFSTKESGTGLGLSIAAGIVHKHGGALQYQTQPGRGTIFGVVLPVRLNDTRERAA